VSGIPARLPALTIFDPAHGQIQFRVLRGSGLSGWRKRGIPRAFQFSRWPVVPQCCRATPADLLPRLRATRFVDHQDGVRITQALQNVGTRDSSRTRSASQTALLSNRCIPSGRLSPACSAGLPAILALHRTDNAFEVRQGSPTRFWASKSRGDTGMQAFEFLPPPPDFDEGGLRSRLR
jgi:hypothetical protein